MPETDQLRLNRLLSSLPPDDIAAIQSRLEPVELAIKVTLLDADEPIDYVYFPTTCVISLLAVMEDGASGEVGVVGNEGMVGLPAVLGGGTMPVRAVVQVDGGALRLPVETLRLVQRNDGAMQKSFQRYAQALLTQVSQSAVCNRLHPTEERAARWLLLTHDRAGRDEFPMTHEFLGQMLGVRRATVTIAQGMLQSAGFIEYTRGRVRILDRESLESASCECYGVIKREYDRLLR